MKNNLEALVEAVNRECWFEVRKIHNPSQGGLCVLACAILVDVFGADRAVPTQVVAIVEGGTNAEGNPGSVELGKGFGKMSKTAAAGHWVTILDGKYLLDPCLGQTKTKLNSQLEARPVALNIEGLPWVADDGTPMCVEFKLTENTTVTYALASAVPDAIGAVNITETGWWNRTSLRRKISSSIKRLLTKLNTQ